MSLVQVQVAIRHGARTPATSCEPYLPAVADVPWNCDGAFLKESVREGGGFVRTFDGCETGQLLPRGVAQHVALGSALRALYGSVANASAYARSSDLSRTRASAEAVLGEVLVDARGSLHVADLATDWIFPNVNVCPRVADFAAGNVSRSEVTGELKRLFGDEWRWGDDMAGTHLMDCVLTSVCEGFASEDLETLAPELLELAERSEYAKVRSADYARLVSAPLVARMRRFLSARAPRFVLWSGHDTTIMPLRVALGYDDGRWPPYASATLLELYRDDRRRSFVRLVADRAPRLIAGCDDLLCPLSVFLEATSWADRPVDCAPAASAVLLAAQDRFFAAAAADGRPVHLPALVAAALLSLGLGLSAALTTSRRRRRRSVASS
mmetsp:Transcript_1964/g.5948  ORF Transcript_1964/g.5948 Transcript_1964/m.5948 type:complete len:382 (+) Transcript_1964:164-1309(+)